MLFFNSKKEPLSSNNLTVDSLYFKYKNQNNLLAGIYLTLNTGDIVGLFGRNGSGKTTLLNIIFGTLKTTQKNLIINNRSVTSPFTGKNNIAYMPQNSFLPKLLTVKKAIALFLEKKAQLEVISDERISKILTERIYNVSGGERRYLEFLMIMALDSKFVILDEPFSQIEPIYSKKMKEIIKAKAIKKGIIITDHDYYNVLDVSNKLMLITQGQIKEIKGKEELVKYGYLSG